MTDERTVKCPQCGAAVQWTPASKWRPFCSQRCQMIDFGAWAAEAYRIPTVEPADDSDADSEPAPDRRN